MLTGAIFCDSDSFVAREIKATTNEDESHVALLFGETVLHFRFLGFETMHIAEFKETYAIKSTLTPPRAVMVSPESIIRHYHGRAYDFLGMAYVALYLLAKEIGITLPGGNYWQNKRDMFCVEFVSEICLGKRGSMLTPGQLKSELLRNGWVECKTSV